MDKKDKKVMARRRYVDRASSHIHSKVDDMQERFSDIEDSIHKMIEKKPLQTLAIAFGAGLIAGALVSKMMHRRDKD